MARYLCTLVAGLAAVASATSLSDICSVNKIQALLPSNSSVHGFGFIPSSVTATAVWNAPLSSDGHVKRTPAATHNYCNVTLRYIPQGSNNNVLVAYAFPEPSNFRNRFYVAGGSGYSLSSKTTGGLTYGAASGASDAGYGVLSGVSFNSVILFSNDTINWPATYMFGSQALGEMTQIGKMLINNGLYGSKPDKLYTYFEGCSDGGREGWSQVQKYGDEYNGVIVGAPAFRHAQQQVLHVFSSAVEHTMKHYPPPCALQKILNDTIAACDPMDGRTDGVIGRSDLCKLNFNLTSAIGSSYHCDAQTSTSLGFGFDGGDFKVKRQGSTANTGSSTDYQPVQSGTVNAHDVMVVQSILDGLFNSKGERAYLSWQIGSSLSDAEPVWVNGGGWSLNIPSMGGEYVAKFIQLTNADNLANLDNVTYDTLVEWMTTGMDRYMQSLQTTAPDLSKFYNAGGKIIHFHGEADGSVPAASSVHYWQSVLEKMYPNSSFSQGADQLKNWYQFYLVPGAGHCGANPLMVGPYPQSNMEIMINWVESGKQPARLDAIVPSGARKGEVQALCQWPERPLWKGDSFDCAFDQASYDSWTYTFPAFKEPVY